jgi:hypothetical protein
MPGCIADEPRDREVGASCRLLMFAGLVVICAAGLALFGYALTRADPYPAFMRDYLPKGSHSYQEAALTFSEFVVRTFPIGSDAKDAISKITKGGFEVTTSNSDSVEFLWKRQAGPCNERYSIAVNQTADGTIAKITGRLHPACL